MTSAISKTVNISASIPTDLLKRLERIAKMEERPKNYYVKKGLERVLEDAEDYLDGIEAYEEYKRNGSVSVSWEEIEEKMKKMGEL